MEELTQRLLYNKAADYISKLSLDYKLEWMDRLAAVYREAARIITVLEMDYIKGKDQETEEVPSISAYFLEKEITSELFPNMLDVVTAQFERDQKSLNKPKISIGYYYSLTLDALEKSFDGIIKNIKDFGVFINKTTPDNYSGQNRVFLSYAYKDKGYSLALFIYFYMNDIFLYVDWMWNHAMTNGNDIKYVIERELERSDQLLFLRSRKSELQDKKDYSIRQWCAWEIGNYYTKNNGEKYYLSIYRKSAPANKLLDTFHVMTGIDSGKIV